MGAAPESFGGGGMNARRKTLFRRHQQWQREKQVRLANKDALNPGTVACQRCGRPFQPEWCDTLARWVRFCGTCQARNLFDGFDMMTPPALIDKFSKRPALTESEFQRSLAKEEA